MQRKGIKKMKTTKLIIGIVSIVLFVIIAFQSCAVGLGNTLSENGEVSGSGGILLAFCMLIAGIIAIACRNSKPGSIVAGAFYAFGGIIGICNAGTYSDLKIWSILSFIFAAVIIIGSLLTKKKIKEQSDEASSKNL